MIEIEPVEDHLYRVQRNGYFIGHIARLNEGWLAMYDGIISTHNLRREAITRLAPEHESS